MCLCPFVRSHVNGFGHNRKWARGIEGVLKLLNNRNSTNVSASSNEHNIVNGRKQETNRTARISLMKGIPELILNSLLFLSAALLSASRGKECARDRSCAGRF